MANGIPKGVEKQGTGKEYHNVALHFSIVILERDEDSNSRGGQGAEEKGWEAGEEGAGSRISKVI